MAKEVYLGSEDSTNKKLDKELYEQYLTKKRALQTAQAELVEVQEKSEASSKARDVGDTSGMTSRQWDTIRLADSLIRAVNRKEVRSKLVRRVRK